MEPETKLESPTWLKRWRRGDTIFKGMYHAGITPKIPRSVLKVHQTSSRNLFGAEKEEVENQYDINPFIEIIPQVANKTRSTSFNFISNHQGEGM